MASTKARPAVAARGGLVGPRASAGREARAHVGALVRAAPRPGSAAARERIAAQVAAGADVVLAPTWRTHRRALMDVGESRGRASGPRRRSASRARAWTLGWSAASRRALRSQRTCRSPDREARGEEPRPVQDREARGEEQAPLPEREAPLVAGVVPSLDDEPEPGSGQLLAAGAGGRARLRGGGRAPRRRGRRPHPRRDAVGRPGPADGGRGRDAGPACRPGSPRPAVPARRHDQQKARWPLGRDRRSRRARLGSSSPRVTRSSQLACRGRMAAPSWGGLVGETSDRAPRRSMRRASAWLDAGALAVGAAARRGTGARRHSRGNRSTNASPELEQERARTRSMGRDRCARRGDGARWRGALARADIDRPRDPCRGASSGPFASRHLPPARGPLPADRGASRDGCRTVGARGALEPGGVLVSELDAGTRSGDAGARLRPLDVDDREEPPLAIHPTRGAERAATWRTRPRAGP